MTFEEYKSKRNAIDKYILKCLADDSIGDVQYKICLYDRLEKWSGKSEIFKEFDHLNEYIVTENKNFDFCNAGEEHKPEESKHSEYEWWQVGKYLLIDGEYEEILRCDITLDGELAHFLCLKTEYFGELFQNKEMMDILDCKNVVSPYETGDIIKFNALPMSECFYAIYSYNERFERHNFFYMCCEEEPPLFALRDLRRTEKAKNCPDEELNEISKKVKENQSLFFRLHKKSGFESERRHSKMSKKRRIEAIESKLRERNLKFSNLKDRHVYPSRLRKTEEIAKRAVISAIVSNCAFDLHEANDVKSCQKEYIEILNRLGLSDELFADERAVLFGDYDDHLCSEVSWQSEAAIALLWALGLIDNIDDADFPDIDDADFLDRFKASHDDVFEKVTAFSSFESFLSKCVLRQEEDLVDMYLLYWFYDWNIIDGMFHGFSHDSICSDVVYERRRAIQWLVYSDESDDGDWNFPMDT